MKHKRTAERLFEVFDGVNGTYLAFVDNDDTVTYSAHFAEDVGAENYGMFLAERLYKAADFHYLIGVKSDGRLVEDEEFRNLLKGCVSACGSHP